MVRARTGDGRAGGGAARGAELRRTAGGCKKCGAVPVGRSADGGAGAAASGRAGRACGARAALGGDGAFAVSLHAAERDAAGIVRTLSVPPFCAVWPCAEGARGVRGRPARRGHVLPPGDGALRQAGAAHGGLAECFARGERRDHGRGACAHPRGMGGGPARCDGRLPRGRRGALPRREAHRMDIRHADGGERFSYRCG